MGKGDYKGMVLTGALTYRPWRAMFIAEWKSEKLWKYVDRSAIIPDNDPRDIPLPVGQENTTVDKKEAYEVGFEQAKKKCFMSVDKTHLATILKLSDPKDMFNALDKKYSATNVARLRQLLSDSQTVSTQKNVGVLQKHEAILNLNAEIRVQKPELAFHDVHLINFLLASMPTTYESIIDNLNMRETLTLEDARPRPPYQRNRVE